MDSQPVQLLKSKWATIRAWPWVRISIIALLCVAATVGAIWLKKIIWPVRPPINTAPQVAQEAPQAAKVEKIYIPGPTKFLVYEREKLIHEIPQPAAVAQNPHNQFTATAQVPSSPYGGTAVAFTNMSSGQSGITYTAKSRPLFGFGGDGGMGLRGGVGAGNESTGYTGSIYVRQKIIRVSDVQISGVGELSISTYQKPEARALVEAELWHWN